MHDEALANTRLPRGENQGITSQADAGLAARIRPRSVKLPHKSRALQEHPRDPRLGQCVHSRAEELRVYANSAGHRGVLCASDDGARSAAASKEIGR